jgi:DNA polymerase-1
MQTDTGLMSTNEKALMGLKGKHKMIDHLLELRHLKKIYSTYLKPIPELASFDGRIHTSFRLAKTATGRLSSSKPNLQNIPKKKDGKAIRDYFTASEGNFLIESDLRQIEYRILAHYVNDPKMIQDIREGLDIHSLTASESYDIPFEEFKRRIKAGDPEAKELRGRAKAVTFGVPYGRSSFSLAKELGMSVDEAEGFRLSLLNRYPRVFQWIEKMLEGARKHGYVKTYFGRIRYLPKINDKNQKLREAEERKVVATCIQGTASDILSTYTINIRERLRKSGAKTKMVLTVHDALFFDAPKDEVPTIVQMLKEEMERPIEGIRVPIETETMIGLRWGSLVEYDKQEKENV